MTLEFRTTGTLRVTRHADFASLAPHDGPWNSLTHGVPFRRWEWVEAWWRHYGEGEAGSSAGRREPYILSVHDQAGQLVGIAPWYRVRAGGAWVIRFLADGEICSDYLSILCRRGQEQAVASHLADWLTAAASKRDQTGDDYWDRLELSGVDAVDAATTRLLEHLQQRGNLVHHRSVPSTWRIPLPATWDDYLKCLSKPHRRRLRNADRNRFHTGRAIARQVREPQEIPQAFEILVDLHQRRWEGRGLPGMFASKPFSGFHREVSQRLAATGNTLITVIELDGTPLATEYQFVNDQVTYAYQAGIDPDRLDEAPGHLAAMSAIREAIGSRHVAFDFLRGDEPYKSHWRATPQSTLAVRVVPPRAAARLRHHAWVAGQNVKQWIKSGLSLAESLTARS